MNVQFIHNATFAHRLPPTFLAQAYALANFHEYGVFSDTSFDGIGNSAYSSLLRSLVNINLALSRIPYCYTVCDYRFRPHRERVGSVELLLFRHFV